jgi:hypothetical protein
MSDRKDEKPAVVYNASSGGWAAAVITGLILVASVVYVMSGGKVPGTDTVNINVEAPKVSAPDAPAAKTPPAAPAANQ